MKKIIAIILITIVATTLCACAGGEDNSAKIKELQQQIEQLQTSLNQNADKIESLEEENATLKTEISKLEEEKKQLKEQLGTCTLEMAYELQRISRNELMTIAYYMYGEVNIKSGDDCETVEFVPEKEKPELTDDLKKELVDIYYRHNKEWFERYQGQIDDVWVEDYYGIFNGHYVYELDTNLYDVGTGIICKPIGDVMFVYAGSSFIVVF